MSYTDPVQYSVELRNNRLQADEDTIGASPVMQIFHGAAKPATAATADAGTVAATLPLPSDWQDDPDAGAADKLGAWEDSSADDTGLARYWRIKEAGPGDCHMQGFCSQPWEQSTVYALNQQVSNANGVYICTTAGMSSGSGTGPSGTGSGISDGSAVWTYLGAASLVLQNVSLAAGQPVEVLSFTRTVGGA